MTNVTLPLDRPSGEPTLIIANTSDQIYQMDRGSVVSTGYVVVGPLIPPDTPLGSPFTLRQLFLEYISDESGGNIILNFSTNGGSSFGSNFTIAVADTNGEIKTESVAPEVYGRDIRVKITLPALVTLRVVALEPVMVVRGNP